MSKKGEKEIPKIDRRKKETPFQKRRGGNPTSEDLLLVRTLHIKIYSWINALVARSPCYLPILQTPRFSKTLDPEDQRKF